MKTLLIIFTISCILNANVSKAQSRFCYSCEAEIGRKLPCEINVSQKTVVTTGCYTGYNACMTLVHSNRIVRACALPTACANINNYTSITLCTRNYCNDKKNSGNVRKFSVSTVLLTSTIILYNIIGSLF